MNQKPRKGVFREFKSKKFPVGAFLRSGLKMGVENDIFWSETGSGFGEPGCTPPPRIPRGTPRALFLSYEGWGVPRNKGAPDFQGISLLL